MNDIRVFTDGGSRGNPGQAAIGVYITDGDGNVLKSIGEKIGVATNNVAEYKAVLKALSWLVENKETIEKYSKISFFLDSQLVYSQINGLFKVKSENIREYVYTAREKQKQLGIPVEWSHVPREKNTNADRLVNLALDNLL